MRIAIVRRAAKASFSMDVYADGIVQGLKAVRPHWEIVELMPTHSPNRKKAGIGSGIWKYYDRYWHFPAWVTQQSADVFHVIDHSDGHIARWLKKAGKPVVVTCHDLINFVAPENVQEQAQMPLISMTAWKFAVRGLQSADRIVTVSSHTAKDVTRWLDIAPGKITVVPNAVEAGFQRLNQADIDRVRQQWGVSPETFCLLNVGSSHPRKNIGTVLEAVRQLKVQKVPVHFCKAGADFAPEQKKFIQTHQLQTHITYLGKPDRQTLIQSYNAADVLVAPSLYEGFGMTILEAMSCGIPVITSNVTSLPEVAGDAAVLVAPTDVQAIVTAVSQIQHDSEYRQLLRQRGWERVKAFTWESAAEKIAHLYEKLVPHQAQMIR